MKFLHKSLGEMMSVFFFLRSVHLKDTILNENDRERNVEIYYKITGATASIL